MRRRDFIVRTGAAIAWPLAAHAQQPVKHPRIALVHTTASIADMANPNDPIFQPFFQELRRLGYAEGQNLAVERYSGEGRTERYAQFARDVGRTHPDLIFTTGTEFLLAFKRATTRSAS